MTTAFDIRNNLCWTAQTAISTLNTEAVSPSAEVFFATHVPLRIRRRHPDLRENDTVQEVSEEEVQRDFLEREPVNGVLLMPVIGESGSGKSHLVRWIAEQTKSDSRRAVIYVPKSMTSLRGLIDVLLNQPDVDSPALDRLRERVDDLARTLDIDTLQRRLLNALAEAIEHAEPSGDRYRRSLIGPGKLGTLLRDPSIQDHLMAAGRLVPRLAASLLDDRGDGESDRPTEFTVYDLPQIADVGIVSVGARPLLAHLQGRAPLQEAAANLLTEQLSQAVQTVFDLGHGKLQNAMLTIRKEYLSQGKEIVLLIEDFAVIQGVQRDLLDALIEVGVREGRTVLAPVRTLMAVTPGYYQRLDETVLTRVRATTPYVYDLDVTLDDSTNGRQSIIEFVGGYLNAARVGANALEAAGVGGGTAPPNRCRDCQFQVACHSAFGASSKGYGLFPFNWSSLRRAIRARKPPIGPDDAFNPRTVLSEVIRPVLSRDDEIVNGEFPGPTFVEMFPSSDKERPLMPEVAAVIGTLDDHTSNRRVVLLEFWGDAPTEVQNLAPAIHEAFGIAPLAIDQESASQLTAPEQGDSVQPTLMPVPSESRTAVVGTESYRRQLQDIDAWYSGKPLGQNAAAGIRSIVRQAVLNRCQWNEPLTVEPLQGVRDKAWPVTSLVVSIEDAGGESAPGTRSAPITFDRTAPNAVFFKSLLTVKAGISEPGNAAALRRLAHVADQYHRALQERVESHRSSSDAELCVGLQVSLLGAALAGRAWPGMSDHELMAVAFDDGADWNLGDATVRLPLWVDAWNKHRAKRPELVAALRDGVGIRRGDGHVRMIDAARVLPLLRQASAEWDWQAPEEIPKWCTQAVKAASLGRFGKMVDEQWETLRRVHSDLEQWLPAGVTSTDTIREIRQALEEAQSEALGPDDGPGFWSHVERVEQIDWQCTAELTRDVRRVLEADGDEKWRAARIKAVSTDRGREIVEILEFLRLADKWLTTKVAEAKLRRGRAEDTATKLITHAHSKWKAIAEKGSL
ncbi:protein DpdH [Nocardia sp. NPDC052278]|uniref:protein DpdH n=1 Tax=unclassified Nocardia TaxID=2637762 RepID=UPI0036B245EC